jgi:hypothetical protein
MSFPKQSGLRDMPIDEKKLAPVGSDWYEKS